MYCMSCIINIYIYEYIKYIYIHIRKTPAMRVLPKMKKTFLVIKEKEKVKHFKAFSGEEGKEIFGLEVKYYLCCALFNLWTQ